MLSHIFASIDPVLSVSVIARYCPTPVFLSRTESDETAKKVLISALSNFAASATKKSFMLPSIRARSNPSHTFKREWSRGRRNLPCQRQQAAQAPADQPASCNYFEGAGVGLAVAPEPESAGAATGGRFDGGGAAAGSPLSRTLFGGIGVMSGLGAGGGGGASWIRSFGAPFTFFGFFLVAVSPFSPSGALCACSTTFSSAVGPAGVAMTFSFAFTAFALALVWASVGARSL